MNKFIFNQKPMTHLELDPTFVPISKGNYEFIDAVNKYGNPQKIKISIERSNNQISSFDTIIFNNNAKEDEANYIYIERLVKTLLWLKGGWKIYIGGSKDIGEKLSKDYSKNGVRSFDSEFMSNIYEMPFTIVNTEYDLVPNTNEVSKPVGRHLDGYRIGFDAGGSDRKVSAVVNGESIYSEEIVWNPKLNSDPKYHYNGIMDSMKRAASKMPQVDAIGVSAAGIYIDNRVSAASLFLKVPKEKFDSEVRNMFLDIQKEMGNVPMEVVNDGDVTALAGAMSLGKNKILGIAMGTSQAAGYVDSKGNITGWLNELCFAPVDYSTNGAVDEWSLDKGCGVKYFSQDAVIRLAEAANIEIDVNLLPAEKLKVVQNLLENNDERAIKIFKTIGVYLGYSVAYYSQFYEINEVLILGRVTSNAAGNLMIDEANKILEIEFNELYNKISLSMPDEKNKRVGQSIAAASLPEL